MKQAARLNLRTAIIWASIFLVIGIVSVVFTLAAGTPNAFEAESGILAGPAKVVAATGASGNSAVQFGPAATPVGGFTHPGILVNRADLDFVKAKITTGTEPWLSALNSAKASRLASLTYVPSPVSSVQCTASYGKTYELTHPEIKDIGCAQQNDDADAAYTQALLWYYTGNRTYAQNSIKIMNAWSGTLTQILFDQPRSVDTGQIIYENGKLQAAWTGETITRAAEIIRYTYTPSGTEPAFNVPQFSKMLNNIILPLTISGWTGGANWYMSFAEATMNIGIFTDNRTTYNAGLAYWRAKTPTIIYLTTDGAYPKAPETSYNTPAKINTYWHNPGAYEDGLEGETCRDSGHMLMGLEAMTNAAETARIQGNDLYGEQRSRMIAGYEFNARYMLQMIDTGSVPSWLCGGALNLPTNGLQLGWEIAYNEFAGRQGIAMPYTLKVINRIRPTRGSLHMEWESLTSIGTP